MNRELVGIIISRLHKLPLKFHDWPFQLYIPRNIWTSIVTHSFINTSVNISWVVCSFLHTQVGYSSRASFRVAYRDTIKIGSSVFCQNIVMIWKLTILQVWIKSNDPCSAHDEMWAWRHNIFSTKTVQLDCSSVVGKERLTSYRNGVVHTRDWTLKPTYRLFEYTHSMVCILRQI